MPLRCYPVFLTLAWLGPWPAGAALALAAWLLSLLRQRYAALRLRERAAERERIARMLHDTFMQSVHVLFILFERSRDGLPPDHASRPLLNETLMAARAVLDEGRDTLTALRGADGVADDLAAALQPFGRLLSAQYGVAFHVATTGQRRLMRDAIARETAFIVREALQNAFRHAGATTVSLSLAYGENELAVRVSDDGRGFETATPRGRHWGVAGMYERADAIGAVLHVDSTPDHGTVIALRVAGAFDQCCVFQSSVRWMRRAIDGWS